MAQAHWDPSMSGSQGANGFADSTAQLAPAPPTHVPGMTAGQASQAPQAMAVTAPPGATAQPPSALAPEPAYLQIPLSREDKRKMRLEERRRKRAALAAYEEAQRRREEAVANHEDAEEPRGRTELSFASLVCGAEASSAGSTLQADGHGDATAVAGVAAAAHAAPLEVPEIDVPAAVFDSVEEGNPELLRTLHHFALMDEEGKLVAPEVLDEQNRGRIQAFGTLIASAKASPLATQQLGGAPSLPPLPPAPVEDPPEGYIPPFARSLDDWCCTTVMTATETPAASADIDVDSDLSLRRRIRVHLPDVKEWCIDYAYGDPTVWLITDQAWYNIAGPLHRQRPHHSYAASFRTTRLKFEACAWIARCLQEQRKKDPTYKQVMETVTRSTAGTEFEVTEALVIDHCEFVLEQIAGLDGGEEGGWYQSCRFYTTLRDRASDFKARLAARRAELDASAARARERHEAKLERDAEREREKLRKIAEREEDKQRRLREKAEAKDAKRYPIDDGQLIEEREAAGLGHTLSSPPPRTVTAAWLPPAFVGPTLSVWLTCQYFFEQLRIAKFSLEALGKALRHSGGEVRLLTDLCVSLTRLVVRGREKKRRQIAGVDDDDDAVANAEDELFDDNLNDDERAEWFRGHEGWRQVGTATWQEICRLAIASREDGGGTAADEARTAEHAKLDGRFAGAGAAAAREHLAATAAGLHQSPVFNVQIEPLEPMVSCRNALDQLMEHWHAQPFSYPIDPELDSVPDYPLVVHHPMDLGTVSDRLDVGAYNIPSAERRLRCVTAVAAAAAVATHAAVAAHQAAVAAAAHADMPGLMHGDDGAPLAPFDPSTVPPASKRDQNHCFAPSFSHEGVRAFVSDVNLVFANAVKYHSNSRALGRIAMQMQRVFEKLYQSDIVARLEAQANFSGQQDDSGLGSVTVQAQAACDTEDESMAPLAEAAFALGRCEFCALRTGAKLTVLQWLCDEALEALAIRDVLNDKAKHSEELFAELRTLRREERERRKAAGSDPEGNADTIDSEEDTSDLTARQIAARADRQQQERASHEARQVRAEHQDGQGVRRVERALTNTMSSLRFTLLGYDRFWSQYFTLPGDSTGRLYVVNALEGGLLGFYASADDLRALHNWLEPKGKRERALRSALEGIQASLERKMGRAESGCDEMLGEADTHGSVATADVPLGLSFEDGDSMDVEDDEDEQGEVEGPTEAERAHWSQSIAGTARAALKALERRTMHPLVIGTIGDGAGDSHGSCSTASFDLLSGGWSNEWPKSMSDAAAAGGGPKAYDALRSLLLKLEEAVVKVGAVLAPNWVGSVRERWQRAVRGARTWSQLSCLIGRFQHEGVAWQVATNMITTCDRREWLRLVDKAEQAAIPDIGEHVVYHGDGHRAARQIDQHITGMSCGALPRDGEVLQCKVTEMSYHAAAGAHPYARITLSPMKVARAVADHATKLRSKTVSAAPCARLALLLERACDAMVTHEHGWHFAHPVKATQFPDYRKIVSKPMHITELQNRVKAHKYRHARDFRKDAALIESNCRAYCEERFPHLPPLAQAVVQQATAFLDREKDELAAAEREARGEMQGLKIGRVSAANPPLPKSTFTVVLRLHKTLPDTKVSIPAFLQSKAALLKAMGSEWLCGDRFESLYEGSVYRGTVTGLQPILPNGLFPWEGVCVAWDTPDDHKVGNFWELERVVAKQTAGGKRGASSAGGASKKQRR